MFLNVCTDFDDAPVSLLMDSVYFKQAALVNGSKIRMQTETIGCSSLMWPFRVFVYLNVNPMSAAKQFSMRRIMLYTKIIYQL